jgi:phage shock protein A
MAQQSIFGRIAQLTRANVNALIDSAEDPEKMLDQMIRDYTNSIAEAQDAVATTIGNLRLVEDDHREAIETAAEWGRKALAASARADQMRSGGQAADADKFDNLAKVALKRQMDAESTARTLAPQVAQQTEVVTKLKAGLDGMQAKLGELKGKRDELVSRAKMAAAQSQVQDSLKSIDLTDPTSDLSRFEDKIRREEAKVRGQAELSASSLDSQFESLEDDAEQLEIEARLAALKGNPPAALP